MANPMMQGPMDAEYGAEQQGEPLKSVTIEQQADGSFLVGTEPQGPDAETTGEADTGMQPAPDIDSALELARQMLQDDGTAGARKAARADIASQVWSTPKAPVKTPNRGMM